MNYPEFEYERETRVLVLCDVKQVDIVINQLKENNFTKFDVQPSDDDGWTIDAEGMMTYSVDSKFENQEDEDYFGTEPESIFYSELNLDGDIVETRLDD